MDIEKLPEGRSLWSDGLRRLFGRKLAKICFVIIMSYFLLAGFIYLAEFFNWNLTSRIFQKLFEALKEFIGSNLMLSKPSDWRKWKFIPWLCISTSFISSILFSKTRLANFLLKGSPPIRAPFICLKQQSLGMITHAWKYTQSFF